MEHAFEDIEVKENAIELLEYALVHKWKKCIVPNGSKDYISGVLSAMLDPGKGKGPMNHAFMLKNEKVV